MTLLTIKYPLVKAGVLHMLKSGYRDLGGTLPCFAAEMLGSSFAGVLHCRRAFMEELTRAEQSFPANPGSP